MRIKSFYLFFFALSCSFLSLAQPSELKLGSNKIEYTDSLFKLFNLKMDSLKNGSISKVRILHIGDSHIQADNFSGATRKGMQELYGNGGRGLIFPYALANAYGPKDFTSTSSSTWTNSWIIHNPLKFQVGLPGIGIQSIASQGNVKISLVKDSIKNPYTTAFAIYSMDQGSKGTIKINDNLQKSNADLPFDTVAYRSLNGSTDLKLDFKDTKLNLHGIYTENDGNGVVYSSAGVTSARYRHYLKNELFFQELTLLKPDLIIISLGTNESYDSNFTESSFQPVVDSMLSKISALLPDAAVVLTAPSENYKIKSKLPIENPTVDRVTAVLRTEAQKYGYSLWDLKEVMGGYGSMLSWKKAGLVNSDYVHYLKKGYQLQGELLFQALKLAVE